MNKPPREVPDQYWWKGGYSGDIDADSDCGPRASQVAPDMGVVQQVDARALSARLRGAMSASSHPQNDYDEDVGSSDPGVQHFHHRGIAMQHQQQQMSDIAIHRAFIQSRTAMTNNAMNQQMGNMVHGGKHVMSDPAMTRPTPRHPSGAPFHSSFSSSPHSAVWSLQSAGMRVIPGTDEVYNTEPPHMYQTMLHQHHPGGYAQSATLDHIEPAYTARNMPQPRQYDPAMTPNNNANHANPPTYEIPSGSSYSTSPEHKRQYGDMAAASLSMADWQIAVPPYKGPDAQYCVRSEIMYPGHNTSTSLFPLQHHQHQQHMPSDIEGASTRDPGWIPSPPKKKPRAQMLCPQEAIEIYKQRPSQMPAGTMLGLHAQQLSKKFNVASNTVRDIWGRRTWVKATRSLWTEEEEQMYNESVKHQSQEADVSKEMKEIREGKHNITAKTI